MMNMMLAGEAAANAVDDVAAPEITSDDNELTRIGDMAKIYGVTLRTLRFYEDKGLLNPKREGSTRLYTRRDRARLKLILLGRKVGFTLRDVKHMIDLYDPNGTNIRQMKVTLEKSEKQLGRLVKQRQTLEEAISDLSGLMDSIRQQLSHRTAANANN